MSSTIGNVRLSNGETCFKQQLGLYNLPYGVFGTLSNIIQFYTFACLGFGRSPFRPSKQLKRTKSDLALSVAAYLTTTAAVAITLVNPDWMSVDSVCRMRKRYWWMYLLILAKFSLGLASGAWSWEMHGIARDKKLQCGANQNAVEERDENPQPNMHDGFDGEFAGGLERGRFTGGRTGWKLSGMFLVIEQIVGIAGLATHMPWELPMTVVSIVCACLVLLTIGWSTYLSKQAKKRELTREESFLRKLGWTIVMVIISSWADLILGLAARNVSGRPEKSIYTFAVSYLPSI